MSFKKFSSLFLLVALLTLGLSLVLKNHYQEKILPRFFGFSYSDIRFNYHHLQVEPTPVPYVNFAFEYPVLLGFFFYLTGRLTDSYQAYFWLNGILLSATAVASGWLIFKLTRKLNLSVEKRRWLLLWPFSATVLLFTVYNWDIVAIALMLLALWFFYQNRPAWVGVFLALGAFCKLFPGFLLLPLLVTYAREKQWSKLKQSALVFVLVSLAINLPFALRNFGFWSYFYKFSSSRGAYGDNIWSLVWTGSRKLWGANPPYQEYYLPLVNWASLGLFGVGYLWLNFQGWKKRFGFLPLCFLCLAWFLLTSKTYSAPFSLWVLPFLALLPVSLPLAVAFDWASAAVFYSFFQYLYYNDYLGLAQSPGHWFAWTYSLVLVRHLFLLLLAWQVWRGGRLATSTGDRRPPPRLP